MINLGQIDAQIIWLLAMMEQKNITSPKLDALLEQLSPGIAREIGEVFAGKQPLDLAWPDIALYVRTVRSDLKGEMLREADLKKGKKNGRK